MFKIIPDTDEVLASMLVESTGRHMLDSGGAYGRGFERNAGRTVEDFRAAPETTPSLWERDGGSVVEYVTLDLFHFLRKRLEYVPEVDADFHTFAMEPERENESWFDCFAEWMEAREVTLHGRGGDHLVVNTYNAEDALSQTIQYYVWDHEAGEEIDGGGVMVALMVHGGCDVRGGYTAPRMFRMEYEYDLMDNADMEVYLQEPEIHHPSPILPLPMVVAERTPRSVALQIRGAYMEDAWTNDEVSDEIKEDGFKFGETPVERDPDSGELVIADGPARGWLVSFYAPEPSS